MTSQKKDIQIFLESQEKAITTELKIMWKNMKNIFEGRWAFFEDEAAGVDVHLLVSGETWTLRICSELYYAEISKDPFRGESFLNYDIEESQVDQEMSDVAQELIEQILQKQSIPCI